MGKSAPGCGYIIVGIIGILVFAELNQEFDRSKPGHWILAAIGVGIALTLIYALGSGAIWTISTWRKEGFRGLATQIADTYRDLGKK